MAKQRISMRKLKEILRLGLDLGCSQRVISSSISVGKTTVQEVLWKAKHNKLSWEQIADCSESELQAKLFPVAEKDKTKTKPLPDWSCVKKELMKKGVTLSLLWLEYKEEYPNGYQYTQFCEYYRQWEKKSKLIMRQNHKAGEKLFVDFSGLKVSYLDLESDSIKQAEIFVAVLGASNYTFAYAVENQNLKNWLECNTKALEFIGGIPEIIVPDNLRSGVNKACRYEPDLNIAYHDFAKHYGTVVIPARANKPRDKAKVEVGVQISERWILACLRKMTFTSVAEINQEIKWLLEKLNNKVSRHLGASRQQLFECNEKEILKRPPDKRYEFAMWYKAKVNIDYHIAIEKHLYSVPFKHVGKRVDVRISGEIVEIFTDGELIATHRKGHPHGRPSTEITHMPSTHRTHAEWTPERICKWAKENGVCTAEICQRIIDRAEHPEQGFRSCLGVIRLGKKYSPERLEAACTRALSLKTPSYKSIKSILQNNMDKLGEPQKGYQSQIPLHENIRGSDYYN